MVRTIWNILKRYLTSTEQRRTTSLSKLSGLCLLQSLIFAARAQPQFDVGQDPPFCLWQITFYLVIPLCAWEYSSSRGGHDLAFSFSELDEMHFSPFPHPIKIPLNGSSHNWSTNHSSLKFVSTKFLRVHSVPFSATMKAFNSMGFHIVLWSVSQETGIHLDLVVLIIVLRAQYFCQFHFTCVSVYLVLISSLSGCY